MGSKSIYGGVGMKLMKLLALAILLACTPCVAFAGSVTLTNYDGTLSSTGVTSGTLSLSGSVMTGLQGLSPYVPDTFGSNIGSVTFTTGNMLQYYNGTTTPSNILTNASFGSGGSITFTYTNGVVFTGSFSSASWTYNAGTNSYTFVGTITNGTLTVPGYNPVNIGTAVTVDLTTVGGSATASGSGYTFTDNGGTTNFTSPALTPVPEPGTLTLLGGGLVGVAMLARRRRHKSEDSAK